MGLLSILGWPLASGLNAVIVESNKPMTGEVMLRMFQTFPQMITLLAPATLIDMLNSELGEQETIRILASAHRIMFSGASLPREVGDKLANGGVKLMTLFGT